MKKIGFASQVTVTIIVMISVVFPASQGDVVINEIAWMGTSANTADEWIELYNTTTLPIDLSDWVLKATDYDPTIHLSGTIGAHSYFLLERTDDNTISDIAADLTYTGNLGNSGEHLQLLEDGSNLIDEIDCSDSWHAGTKSPDFFSMEKKHPNINGNATVSWADNNGVTINGQDASGDPINGTPKAQNSVFDASLPVELSLFSAKAYTTKVVLTWQTESEIDNQGFYVLKSDAEEGEFNIISNLIDGAGTSTIPQNYEYMDDNVIPGQTHWYKLKQVDFSGQFEFYGPLEVLVPKGEDTSPVDVPSNYTLNQNYPNPFNPQTTISYAVSGSDVQRVRLTVYDLQGRVVAALVNEDQSAGQYSVNWDGRDESGLNLPSGLYIYRICCGSSFTASRVMVKLH